MNRPSADIECRNAAAATLIAGTCLILLLVCSPVHAQTRVPPHLGFVYPAGGQQGATFTVSVGGQTLAGATAAHVSGEGVSARVTGYDRPLTQKELNDLREKLQRLQEKRAAARAQPGAPTFTAEDESSLDETRTQLATRGTRPASPALAETLTLEVTVSPNAAAGERELRIKTAAGLSNPIVFCVGTLPETTEPVVTATAKPPPAAGGGKPTSRVAAAKKNETTLTLPALVNGQILPGEVDRFRFAGRKGQRVTIMAAARSLIPYLADAVPGWFQPTLTLYDGTGREIAYADDFRFHPDPALLCALPADGDYVVEIKDALYRGREDFVYRIAVGALPFVTAIFPLGGRAGDDLRVDATGWNLPTSALTIDTMGRGRGVFELGIRGDGALSNPVRLALDERPAMVELEPNDSFATAQPVSLPLTIDGRIGARGDVDVFQVTVAAAGPLVAETMARRLNSPLDSVIEVLAADGSKLAVNDDFEDKGVGLLTHQADSRIEVNLPSAGVYLVRVTDAQQNGGPEYGYRLRLGAPAPDFALRVVPSTINVRAGAAATLTAYALRRDGYDGEITLALKDAPKGYVLDGGRIPAGADRVQLTITVPTLPADAPQTLTLVGVATIGDQRIAHVAVPAEDRMQAFAYRHLVPAQELKINVLGRGTTFRLLSRAPVAIPVGGTVQFRIGTPPARSVGNVALELPDPPPGIALVRCTTAADHINVVLSCDPATAKAGSRGNLIFQAIGERRGAAHGKTSRSPLGTVPAIPYEIVAAPPPST